MSAVLGWVKTNVISVIFFVVMIAAIVALPLVAKSLNGTVRKAVDDRVKQYKDLEKLEKTNVNISRPAGGDEVSGSVLVNENLLRRFEQITQAEAADARQVYQRAVAHNRKERGVILASLFPEPPPTEREVLPREFHRQLVASYERLLERVRAGGPPDPKKMSKDLARRRAQFFDELGKDVADSLSADEEADLRDDLSRQRLSLYAAAAEQIGMYADSDALGVPGWDQANLPSPFELFDWQWKYWLIEDVLLALAEANGDASVQRSPVKRVLALDVVDYVGASERSAGPGGGGSPGFSGAGGGRRGAGSDRSGPAARAAKPSQEIKLDYNLSFTGRGSNPLYDVRLARLEVVADTARIPKIFDALASRNFMTVLDVDVEPIDPYGAATDGYFYGSRPLSRLTIDIETIWLREWTGPFMPPEVKQALGVPDTPPPPSG